jgi:hypothetical protein
MRAGVVVRPGGRGLGGVRWLVGSRVAVAVAVEGSVFVPCALGLGLGSGWLVRSVERACRRWVSNLGGSALQLGAVWRWRMGPT